MKSYQGTISLPADIIPELLELHGTIQMAATMGFFRNMINFQTFKQDTDFHAVIKEIGVVAGYMLINHESARNDVLELINFIDNELE